MLQTFFVRLCFFTLVLLQTGVFASLAADSDSCFYCGMYQHQFSHSWMELHVGEAGPVGFCSLHCASIHMALHPQQPFEQILVSDYRRKTLIEADTAVWVIGGDLPGVMTTRAKWAFLSAADADEFMVQHGGTRADFAQVLEAAFGDMHQDVHMIQNRRVEQRSRRE